MVHVRGVITSQRSRRTTRLHFGTLYPVRDIVLTLLSTHLARKKKLTQVIKIPKYAELAKNAVRACMRSCGRRSAATRPTACRAAASRAPSPALRPGLTGTRRRKRRRGPFGPEVDQSSCATATPSNLRPENPLARGSAPPDRHPAQRRRSTISARPQARRAADICARSGG